MALSWPASWSALIPKAAVEAWAKRLLKAGSLQALSPTGQLLHLLCRPSKQVACDHDPRSLCFYACKSNMHVWSLAYPRSAHGKAPTCFC
jgi:hypothetical protein